tara:strand:+ start:385 stop:546 length:162 start_codon:yes stop_codon:yes gene_type:complete
MTTERYLKMRLHGFFEGPKGALALLPLQQAMSIRMESHGKAKWEFGVIIRFQG